VSTWSSSTVLDGTILREVIKEKMYRNAGVRSWWLGGVLFIDMGSPYINDEQTELEVVQRLLVRLGYSLIRRFRLAVSRIPSHCGTLLTMMYCDGWY
jgi:hypothetical protein